MLKLRGKRWLIGVTALVLVMAIGAGVAAAAANTAPGQQAAELKQFFVSRLAANLGIDTAQLEQAFKQSALETGDQAVAQGIINQERANQIKQAVENGNWNGLGLFLGPQFGRKPAGKMPFGGQASIASILGMSPADLASELKSGKTLADIAQEKGMTLDQIKEKLVAQEKQALDQKVAEGKMTQDTENKILSRLQQMDLNKLGRFGGHAGKVRQAEPTPSVQQ
ncbi:hypothetical protein SEF58_02600 [Neomoorella humiferrea]|uniref:hypothetical protein n=1 Tax=Neomoorella humiferrea TaxID=676965 RepID=UPI003D8D337B